jgi:exosortase family protein XrtF
MLFYLLITGGYKLYLKSYDTHNNEVDGITTRLSEQVVSLLQYFESDVTTMPLDSEPAMSIFFKGERICRIIEGCNAISVIILFAAFVFAFSSGFKKTSLFILIGVVLIYLLNIIRIVILIPALFYYPEYEVLLHDVIFPLFIYGVVFLLWILWVMKISGYGKVTQ